ncbi:flagellar export chaperone FliS [Desulfobulbus oligotrophicus]|uniref:Flagellar secretion chaperone FliS n=1 Tax=Desulfobulbus oligotrophicus TaxID=1909699 RepID=A0A7T5VDP7_9BACT|nr:flagellar export chaperone FliS [Desulfobulbus oligotrophicus]QQG65997.1 flagellar export chaperone FliS [Desulfobulbus oligotrophicus]
MSGYPNQYLASTVFSASPEQLLLMLYDGAIRFISLAIQAIDNNQIDRRTLFINKTTAIISEFAATLDHSRDAQLTADLDALYRYMLTRMMQANLKNEATPLIEVKEMLVDLRATWAQAIEINKNEKRAAAGIPTGPEAAATYRPLAAAM